MFLRLAAATIPLLSILAHPPVGIRARRPGRDEAGQATAEYALVLVAVAALTILLVVWARKGNPVGALFDLVFEKLTNRAHSADS